jgi:adenylate cyclase
MAHDAAGNASPHPTSLRPDAAEVTAELQRVLGSQCFEQSDRAKAFLRFVVEETLAGRGDRLKGYTIGVEVFGRPADFDAQTDPLVRVEAGRIRRRLAEYYGTEGARNPLRIELTRGGYTPQFAYVQGARPADAVAAEILGPAEPPAPRGSTRFLVAGAAVAATLFGLIFWRALDPATTPTATTTHPIEVARPGPPKVLVLPFANLSDDAKFDYFAHGITEEIILRLAEFDVLVISDPRSAAEPDSLATVAPVTGVGYVLAGTVRNTPDRVRLSVRLLTADTGEQLWGEAFDEPAAVGSLLAFQERIAERVAGMVTRPLGPIFQQQLARTTHTPPEHLDTYDCVLKFRYYRHTFAAVDHAGAAACFRDAVVREPNLADAWGGLALLYVDEWLYGYSPQPDPDDALTRAAEVARTALDIDGDNRLANLAMARVRLSNGDVEGFRRAADRLLELRPRYADDLMTIGSLLVVTGDSDRGVALVEEALVFYAPDRPPGIYFVAHALHALATGDYDRALERALKIDVPEWAVTSIVVAASAGLAGEPEIAQRAAQRLLDLDPEFPLHARAQLEKWHPHEALLMRLLEGIEAAGLDVP